MPRTVAGSALGAGAVALCAWAQLARIAGPGLPAADGPLVTAGFALARFGVHGVPHGARRYVELAPVAAYGTHTGAFDRGLLATGRELMLLATVLAAALLWLLARRLGLSAAAAAGAVLLFGLPPFALSAHQYPDPAALAVPWLLAAVVLGTIRRWRPAARVAAASCLVVAALVVPVAGDPIAGRTVFLLAWPAVALGVAWGVTAGSGLPGALRSPEGRPVPIRVAVAAAWVAAAAVAAVLVSHSLRVGPDTDQQRVPAAAARDWVLANLRGDPWLAVDDVTWVELVRAGYPAERVLSGSGLGPVTAVPGGWRGIALVIADPARPGTLAPDAVLALINSRPQARFGTDGAVREVRYVVPDLAAATALAQQERDATRAAGISLAGNQRLDLSAGAARALRRGEVDPRVVSVLAAIAAEHGTAVADFPAVPGEQAAGVPRRVVRFATLDGRPAARGPLRSWLISQLPPYRPAVIAAEGQDLVVRYDPPTPLGLLTS